MTIEPISLLSSGGGATPTPMASVQAGYNVSFTDLGRFDNAVHSLQMRLEMQPIATPSPAWIAVGKPLDQLNLDASGIVDHARKMKEHGLDKNPGEVTMFAARCQLFGVHCQLLHTAANKSSEGLSQLFRQQS